MFNNTLDLIMTYKPHSIVRLLLNSSSTKSSNKLLIFAAHIIFKEPTNIRLKTSYVRLNGLENSYILVYDFYKYFE